MSQYVTKRDASQPVTMFEGVTRRTLGSEAAMMVIEVTLDKGAVVPMHDHPHEQVGYVVRGRVQFVINGETLIAETGDSYAIAGGIPHEATALEDSVVIDVFSPPREEYR